MQEKKNIIIAEYMQYRFEDLEIEEKAQSNKSLMANLSPAVRMEALLRLEVIELAQQAFMNAVDLNHDVTGMKLETAVCLVTGKSPQQLSYGPVGRAYNGLNSGLDKTVDVTVDAVKNGLNKFGGWLTKITQDKK